MGFTSGCNSNMFYNMTGCCVPWIKLNTNSGSRKEGNVLFNDALNTFYLYGIGYMIKI